MMVFLGLVLSERMVDTGIFMWDIPHLDNVYRNCLIKIKQIQERQFNFQKNFTIVNQSNKIQIDTPNGGELLKLVLDIKLNGNKWPKIRLI